MLITEETIQFCIDTLAAEVAVKFSENHFSENHLRENQGRSVTEALRAIMATKTYELLMDEKSFL
jgi:uncharacterized membrane protein YqiK